MAWGGEPLPWPRRPWSGSRPGRPGWRRCWPAGARVYGVSTGTGWLASVDLGPAAPGTTSATCCSAGRSAGRRGWRPAEARALLVARLGNLLSGHAGVGPELCRFLVDRVNDGFVPAVPRRGVGCAGEVIPLAHAFQTLVGAGLVIGPGGAVRDAGAALAERGAPTGSRPRRGSPCSPGRRWPPPSPWPGCGPPSGWPPSCWRRRRPPSTRSAPLDPYDEAVGRLAGDPLLEEVLADLRRATGGGHRTRAAGAGVVPGGAPGAGPAAADPGAAGRGRAAGAGGRHRLPAVVGGRVVAGAGSTPSGWPRDGRGRGGARPGGRAGRPAPPPPARRPLQRAARPAQPRPRAGDRPGRGPQAGRRGAARGPPPGRPASVGQADTSLGQEDAASFAPEAAEQLRRVEELAREVVACELLAARQAWWLRATAHGGPTAAVPPPPGTRPGPPGRLPPTWSPRDRDRPRPRPGPADRGPGARRAAPAVAAATGRGATRSRRRGRGGVAGNAGGGRRYLTAMSGAETYLDAASTTPLHPVAGGAGRGGRRFGDPSRLYGRPAGAAAAGPLAGAAGRRSAPPRTSWSSPPAGPRRPTWP